MSVLLCGGVAVGSYSRNVGNIMHYVNWNDVPFQADLADWCGAFLL
ncbi:MAG: hypothetical protein WCP20_06255 [Desulfuromonadales bacterium]